MSNYIKYHKASGHIFMKFTAEPSSLAGFQESGFECIPADMALDISKKYVTAGGVLNDRVKLNHAVQTISSVVGENISISGLPTDSWVICNGEMIKSSSQKVSIGNNLPRKKYVDVAGKYYGNGFTLSWIENLVSLKEAAKDKIDVAAEEARAKVITLGSGQAMTYLRKADAARAFLAQDTISEAQMARLTDEATRLGVTTEQAAETLVATADYWEAIDAEIDNLRLTKKDAVENATTGAMIEGIINTLVWPA